MTELDMTLEEAAPPAQPAKRRPGRPRKAAAAPPAPPVQQAMVDLDALALEAREDIPVLEPFTFKYKGRVWTLNAAMEADARLLVNIELSDTQQIMLYLKDLLGDKQWAEFPRIDLVTALKLIEEYSNYSQGTDDLGE